MTVATGIHEDIPFDDYLAMPQISFSDLENWLAGKGKSLGRRGLIGTLMHCLVLEGAEAVKARYVKLDANYDLRYKEGRAAKAAAEAGGKVAVKPTDWAQCVGMYEGIGRCERALTALSLPSKREAAVIAQLVSHKDKEGNPVYFKAQTKGRVDLLHESVIIDLKTTHCMSHEFFVDSIVDFNYAARAAFYVDNVAAVVGKFLPFRWICVSTVPPYDAWIEEVTNEQLAFGRKYYRALLKLYDRYGKEEVKDEPRTQEAV